LQKCLHQLVTRGYIPQSRHRHDEHALEPIIFDLTVPDNCLTWWKSREIAQVHFNFFFFQKERVNKCRIKLLGLWLGLLQASKYLQWSIYLLHWGSDSFSLCCRFVRCWNSLHIHFFHLWILYRQLHGCLDYSGSFSYFVLTVKTHTHTRTHTQTNKQTNKQRQKMELNLKQKKVILGGRANKTRQEHALVFLKKKVSFLPRPF